MRNYARVAALLLFGGLAACSQSGDTAVTETEMVPWAEFAATAVAEYYSHNPEQAVDSGLHQYDGQIVDLSPDSVAEYLAWVRKTRNAAQSYGALEGMDAFERKYLIASMNEEVFNFETAGYLSRSPAAYVGQLGFSVYVDREYAPLDVRMRAYTIYVAQFPAFFETMRSNLQPPLARPLIEMSLARFGGLVGYMETTVPEIFAGVEDEALQAEFATANATAVKAVRGMVEWLDGLTETAHDDFALGEERFLEMLSAMEGVDISLAELKAAGERDLERNLRLLDEACAEFAPGKSIRDCVLDVQNRKPEGGAVVGARAQLPGLRVFLEEQKLVTIPGTEEALRGGSLSLDS